MEDMREIMEEVGRARGKAFGDCQKMTKIQLMNHYIEHMSKIKAFELISKHKEPEIKEEDAQDDNEKKPKPKPKKKKRTK